jgi:hypothetical protein
VYDLKKSGLGPVVAFLRKHPDRGTSEKAVSLYDKWKLLMVLLFMLVFISVLNSETFFLVLFVQAPAGRKAANDTTTGSATSMLSGAASGGGGGGGGGVRASAVLPAAPSAPSATVRMVPDSNATSPSLSPGRARAVRLLADALVPQAVFSADEKGRRAVNFALLSSNDRFEETQVACIRNIFDLVHGMLSHKDPSEGPRRAGDADVDPHCAGSAVRLIEQAVAIKCGFGTVQYFEYLARLTLFAKAVD